MATRRTLDAPLLPQVALPAVPVSPEALRWGGMVAVAAVLIVAAAPVLVVAIVCSVTILRPCRRRSVARLCAAAGVCAIAAAGVHAAGITSAASLVAAVVRAAHVQLAGVSSVALLGSVPPHVRPLVASWQMAGAPPAAGRLWPAVRWYLDGVGGVSLALGALGSFLVPTTAARQARMPLAAAAEPSLARRAACQTARTAPTSHTLVAALSRLPEPVWLFGQGPAEGVIAEGMIVILTAPPKRGKTTLLLAWLAALTSGREFLGYPAPAGGPRRVLYCSEEGPYTLREPLRRFGLWDTRPPGEWYAKLFGPRLQDRFRVLWQHEARAAGGTWPARVEQYVSEARRFGASVIIFDTFSGWVSLDGSVSENDNQAMRAAVDPLRAASQRYGMTFVLVTHAPKDARPGGSLVEWVRGASGLAGAVDAGLLLEEGPTATMRRLRVIGRAGIFDLVLRVVGASVLRVSPEQERAVPEVALRGTPLEAPTSATRRIVRKAPIQPAAGEQTITEQELPEMQRLVLETMRKLCRRGGATQVSRLAQRIGRSRRTIREHLLALEARGLIERHALEGGKRLPDQWRPR